MFALIDLDDTLVDKSGAFRRWAQALVDSLGLGDEALRWLVATDKRMKRREPFFQAVVEQFPGIGEPAALWDGYVLAMPTLVEVYPGVRDQLVRLRTAGFRLCVVTNGRARNPEGKLTMTKLAPLVDAVVISESVGLRKPASEIFAAGLAALGCSDPASGWMVGDDPALDITPAAALGTRTAWVSHGRIWPDRGAPPDVTATTPAHALSGLTR